MNAIHPQAAEACTDQGLVDDDFDEPCEYGYFLTQDQHRVLRVALLLAVLIVPVWAVLW